MNQISRPTLPIATAAPDKRTTDAGDPESPDDADSFDSLLQHRCGESADANASLDSRKSTEKHVTPPGDAESLDNPDLAEIAAMFPLQNVPAPVPTPILTIDPAPEEIALSNHSNAAVDTKAVTLTPSADIGDDAPAPADPRKPQHIAQVVFASQQLPKVSAEPAAPPAKPQVDADADASQQTTTALQVANMLRSTPPMQAAGAAQVEPAMRDAQASSGIRLAVDSEPAIAADANPTAPAISTAQNSQPTHAGNKNLAAALQPVDAAQFLKNTTVISGSEKTDGMTAAKPGSEMSATTFQRPQQAAKADSVTLAPSELASSPITLAGTQTLQTAPIQTLQNGREQFTSDGSNGEEVPTSPAPEISFANFSPEAARATFAELTPKPIHTPDVERVVTQTLHAAQGLRTSGQDRVEVAVKLDNGSELTVQLRLENGQVMPVIRTESEALRVALEQNWSQFSQRGSDRELRIANPVFESPQTSSNMSDLNQQRDGRQRAFQEQDSVFPHQYLQRRNSGSTAPQPATPATAPHQGVRLYA